MFETVLEGKIQGNEVGIYANSYEDCSSIVIDGEEFGVLDKDFRQVVYAFIGEDNWDDVCDELIGTELFFKVTAYVCHLHDVDPRNVYIGFPSNKIWGNEE